MTETKALSRLLALDPCAHGVGFVVIEEEKRVVDWGVRECKRHNEASFRAAVYGLVDRYAPDTMVTERNTGSGCRRGVEARCFIDAAKDIADERHIRFCQYSMRQVKAVFAQWNALTKDERAGVLVERLPVLGPYRPPRRRPWKSEDRRFAYFDALAFAVTHQYFEHRKAETLKTIPF